MHWESMAACQAALSNLCAQAHLDNVFPCTELHATQPSPFLPFLPIFLIHWHIFAMESKLIQVSDDARLLDNVLEIILSSRSVELPLSLVTKPEQALLWPEHLTLVIHQTNSKVVHSLVYPLHQSQQSIPVHPKHLGFPL